MEMMEMMELMELMALVILMTSATIGLVFFFFGQNIFLTGWALELVS